MYFQRANFIIIVFDLTSQTSFDGIDVWYDLAKTKAPPNIQYVLVGNKRDRTEERAVELDAAEAMQGKIGANVYVETSAMTGDGMDLLRDQLEKLAGETPVQPEGNEERPVGIRESPAIPRPAENCC
jgi:GTPase SAR1 family protein